MAAVPLFGVAQDLSHGFAVTCILIAMGAMAITAVSYGRMATLYPSAGSAYTYIDRGLNPHLGFLVGWAMLLDYLDQPIINGIYVALIIQRLLPAIPYVLLAAACVGFVTYLNLRSIRAAARVNEVMLAIMTAVIGLFIILAIRYLFKSQGMSGLFSVQPFYDPHTFTTHAIATGTSLAALTYIGFDGVTLLSEEVKNPKRNVLLAGVMVCVFTGIFSGLQIYLAQRVWPDYRTFPHLETAFLDVSRLVGHTWLFNAMAAVLLVSSLGCALTGQLGATRLLYSMGRDKVLPPKPFAYLGRNNVPTINVLIIGVLAFLFTQIWSYELAAEMLNFGAFIAFMGVNFTCFVQFYLVRQPGRKRHLLKDAIDTPGGILILPVDLVESVQTRHDPWSNLARHRSALRGHLRHAASVRNRSRSTSENHSCTIPQTLGNHHCDHFGSVDASGRVSAPKEVMTLKKSIAEPFRG